MKQKERTELYIIESNSEPLEGDTWAFYDGVWTFKKGKWRSPFFKVNRIDMEEIKKWLNEKGYTFDAHTREVMQEYCNHENENMVEALMVMGKKMSEYEHKTSIRDQFAMAALSGLIKNGDGDYYSLAEACYLAADRMMYERNN